MADTTLPGVLLPADTHANRPAANAVAGGSIYPCTTHGLAYQSDGVSTWSNWLTLGTDGADGVGVPVGGSTGEVLAKASGTDFDTDWVPVLGLPLGLTGAVAATRYVGGTASGAPASGTFAIGDFIIDRSGSAWVCTVAGTPGTWVQLGAGGSGVTVEDEGAPLSTTATTLDFVGAGVTASGTGATKTITIPGGGGGGGSPASDAGALTYAYITFR